VKYKKKTIPFKLKFPLATMKTVPFTLKLAKRFINMEASVSERGLKARHVESLLRDAKAGKFLCTEVSLASCICGWDGKERRLNGRHVAWMRTYMPASWRPKIRVEKYTVETEDDFRQLYSTFDTVCFHRSRP
jgi:hypothetical protein